LISVDRSVRLSSSELCFEYNLQLAGIDGEKTSTDPVMSVTYLDSCEIALLSNRDMLLDRSCIVGPLLQKEFLNTYSSLKL
jgi:hypothetical protein